MQRVIGAFGAIALAAVGVTLAASVLASAGGNPPQTYTVNRNDDIDQADCTPDPDGCSLRDAITKANGDFADSTIIFAGGITSITLSLGALPQVTATLAIDGAGTVVTIDAGGSNRILDATADLTLDDLTLRDGAPPTTQAGGAIHSTAAVTVNDTTTFENNVVDSTQGGAISAPSVTINAGAVFTGNQTVTGTNQGGCISAGFITVNGPATFDDNSATGGGGCLAGGVIDVDQATFTANDSTGNRGGAISSSTSTTVTNSVFGGPTVADGNNGSVAGGAISALGGSIAVSNSTFENNNTTLSSQGGAIYSAGSSVTVTESTFRSNRAANTGGGAITIDDAFTGLTVQRSTFVNNTAPGAGRNGGAILVKNGDADAFNSTFTGNTSGGNGGAIYTAGSGASNLKHVTIDGDGSPGGAVFNDTATLRMGATIVANPTAAGPACAGTITPLAVGHNLTFGTVGTCPTGGTNITGLDPQLGPLQDNGGPTPTKAPAASSPALDVIAPVDCEFAVDQRNVDRPVVPDCDIGAVELDLRPDGLIKKGADPFLGMDVFNNDGTGQTYEQMKRKRRSALYTIRARSAAEFLDDDIAVTGDTGNNKFKVKYFDGATEITSSVVGAGYELADVAPQATHDLTLKVKVKVAANKGNSIDTLVTSTSGVKSDTVKAVTTRK